MFGYVFLLAFFILILVPLNFPSVNALGLLGILFNLIMMVIRFLVPDCTSLLILTRARHVTYVMFKLS